MATGSVHARIIRSSEPTYKWPRVCPGGSRLGLSRDKSAMLAVCSCCELGWAFLGPCLREPDTEANVSMPELSSESDAEEDVSMPELSLEEEVALPSQLDMALGLIWRNLQPP